MQELEASRSGTGRRQPDLVFLDLKIPNVSGFELLSWIRERQFVPPLSVAVLSGSEHASDVQRAHALGAAAYYVKPLSMAQLRARIAAWHAEQPGADGTAPAATHQSAPATAVDRTP